MARGTLPVAARAGYRPKQLFTGLLICCGLSVAVPASASATHWRVDVGPDGGDSTEFHARCHLNCDMRVRVWWQGRLVKDHVERYWDDSYNWSCKRTGRHRWKVWLIPSFSGHDAPAPKTGTFRVGRCGESRPEFVGRARAARYATSGEFATDVSCSPGYPRRGRKAARWKCFYRLYHSYRSCLYRDRIWWSKRLMFGEWRHHNGYKTRRISCRNY